MKNLGQEHLTSPANKANFPGGGNKLTTGQEAVLVMRENVQGNRRRNDSSNSQVCVSVSNVVYLLRSY